MADLVTRWLSGALVTGFVVGTSLLGILALAYFAAFGFGNLSVDPTLLGEFATLPGLGKSLWQTLFIGLISTAIGVVIALLLPASSKLAQLAGRLAPMLLAIPHLSMAVALAFLLSPSGWLVRLLSPWATGFERPPIGFGGELAASALLIFGLVVKEVPFLLLVTLSQLRQIDEPLYLKLGQTLGYSRSEAWLKLVLPQLYKRLRPAIIAVLMFALANVEMALPMGPTNPATLAVMALDLLSDPAPMHARLGALAALSLIGLGLLALLLWYIMELTVRLIGQAWLVRGAGSRSASGLMLAVQIGAGLVIVSACTALLTLAIWSVAGSWRFPDALPQALDFARFLARLSELSALAWTTIWVATLSVGIAMILAVFWLEYRQSSRLPFWLYLPLLIPQIAILAGLNFLLLSAGFGITLIGVVAGHIVFILPYVIMVLGDGFYALDPRYARTARSLGHSRLAVLWRLKLPLLRPSLSTAAAIGFAVSVALYLPTIFAGGGRVSTLATEMIALSHGGDRRAMAAAGLTLAVLPLLALVAAEIVGRPRWQQQP